MFLKYTFVSQLKITAELKDSILRKTEKLFLKYGIKSVTMDDIARELGISKKTLYQFFENKTDLLSQIVANTMQRDINDLLKIQAASKNALDELFNVAQHIIAELKRISSATAVYDLQKYYPEIWRNFEDFQNEHIFQFVKKNLERGAQEALYRDDLDPSIIAKLYVSKTMCVIDEEQFPTNDYDKIKLFKQFFSYHIRGIATAKGLKLFEKQLQELIA